VAGRAVGEAARRYLPDRSAGDSAGRGGPMAGLRSRRVPLRIAGPLRIERPGLARFTVQELSLRGFPFPPPVVRQLAQRVAGADTTGAVPLRVSPGFADVRIHPTAVVLYRLKRSAP